MNFYCVLFCGHISLGVHGNVKDWIEKFVVLPFSMGCVSQASVAVAEQRPRRSKLDFISPLICIKMSYLCASFLYDL